MKYITLGCKTNQAETESIRRELETLGVSDPDLVIINTCAVTASAERKSRNLVSRHKDKKVIVMGCHTSNFPTATKVFGTDKSQVVDFVRNSVQELQLWDSSIKNERRNVVLQDATDYKLNSRTREYYLKIQEGCNNFCTFCIVPHLRGRSKSRSLDEVLAEAKQIDNKTIVITGINIGDFPNLPKLCLELDKLGKFKLSTLYITALTGELVETLKSCKNFIPEFHLSLQSCSDSVLKSMGRNYTQVQIHKVINQLRIFPKSKISTDIIVGFPTETDANFEETRSFLDEIRLDSLHIFPYSPRPGTVAATLPQLTQRVVTQRANMLQSLYGKRI